MSTTRSGAEDMAPLFSTHGSGGLQPGVDLDDKEALADLMGDNTAP